ncbi:hypothetical protein GKC30_02450 [Pseudodesulfovibrio sp. F-1]|uniref:Glucosyl transferase GtrII n=1 Tax=Pseudodesulfovibrio alkaliphilus TaxID=2661613 RepID=A0A7K1KKD4_9BACT|nr:glucosyltransferase domain-containing protein [Pseudodesulfovibrio alkaliphilus]MUM76490.1 hypothetical protein [Pseudodesulfovibrio alkaliphilus]
MESLINLDKEDRKFCLYFGVLLLLYFLPIIIAGYPVNDDYHRIFRGSSWDDDGRFLASLAHRLLGHSLTIYNPAPLPLLLSILIFTYGGLLIKKTFLPDNDALLSPLLALGFIINPFLILILVFQLDSIGIALSLVLLIIPFAIRASQFKKRLKYHACCVVFIFLSLNSYQASLGFFLSLAFIEFLYRAKQGQPVFKALSDRILQLGTGYLSYKIFLLLPVISNNARRPARSQLIEFNREGVELFASNSIEIITTTITSLSYLQLTYFTALFILSIWLSFSIYKQAKSPKKMGVAQKIVMLLLPATPFIILFSSFAHLAAIDGFWHLGKLHSLTSFSGLTAFLFLALRWRTGDRRTLLWVLTPIITLSLSFSYLTANVVKAEYEFHASTITSIVNEINDQIVDEKVPLYVAGSLPRSHYFNRISRTFPIFNALGTNIGWALMYRLSYSGCAVDKYLAAPEEMTLRNSLKEFEIIQDSHFYQISRSDDGLLLTLKGTSYSR